MDYEEALSDENPYMERICNHAKELQITVVVTAITKGKEKPQNRAFVIDKKGKR